MTFQAIAEMAHDTQLTQKVAAAAAVRPEVYENDGHPVAWANNNAWKVAARPGWASAYAEGGAEAITDAMISAAVEELMIADRPGVPDGI